MKRLSQIALMAWICALSFAQTTEQAELKEMIPLETDPEMKALMEEEVLLNKTKIEKFSQSNGRIFLSAYTLYHTLLASQVDIFTSQIRYSLRL